MKSISKFVDNMRLARPPVLERTGPLPLDDRNSLQRGIAAHAKRQYLKAMEAWKQAAEQGDAEASYRIGLLYVKGEGVVRSIPDAVVWYERAAEAGHPEAQHQLGCIYLHGAKAGPNGPDSWFQAVCEHDSEAAQEKLRLLFPNGIEVEQDLERALYWMKAAAKSGKLEAQTTLAEMYRRGHGCPQDFEAARAWYFHAAKQGHAAAQFGLGDIYYQGLGVPVDQRVGADWYERAAEQGDARAQVALAAIFRAGQGRPADQQQAARLFVRAAEQNEPRGLYGAALMYLQGEGLPKNIDRAETYLRKAAKQNYLPAIVSLAQFYAHGGGVEPDLREAAEWYTRAAELGDVQSQFIIGRLYAAGTGVPQNLRESARWFLRAAEQGNATAAHNIAVYYAKGTGVERDAAKALEWFQVAAAAGITASQVQLGKIYSAGDGIPVDRELAAKWLEKAAQSGDTEAKTALALLHLQGEGAVHDPEHAEELLKQAAESGDAAAATQLGHLYSGKYSAEVRARDAISWYKKAAEAGNVEAQHALGMRYFGGRGVKADFEAAAGWIEKAAQSGHAPAQFQLAVMYCTGKGVAQDLPQAVVWYENAARLGHALAQYNLAVMLSKGQGCEADQAKALAWFQKAAAQGLAEAQNALRNLSRVTQATKGDPPILGAGPPKLAGPQHQPTSEPAGTAPVATNNPVSPGANGGGHAGSHAKERDAAAAATVSELQHHKPHGAQSEQRTQKQTLPDRTEPTGPRTPSTSEPESRKPIQEAQKPAAEPSNTGFVQGLPALQKPHETTAAITDGIAGAGGPARLADRKTAISPRMGSVDARTDDSPQTTAAENRPAPPTAIPRQLTSANPGLAEEKPGSDRETEDAGRSNAAQVSQLASISPEAAQTVKSNAAVKILKDSRPPSSGDPIPPKPSESLLRSVPNPIKEENPQNFKPTQTETETAPPKSRPALRDTVWEKTPIPDPSASSEAKIRPSQDSVQANKNIGPRLTEDRVAPDDGGRASPEPTLPDIGENPRQNSPVLDGQGEIAGAGKSIDSETPAPELAERARQTGTKPLPPGQATPHDRQPGPAIGSHSNQPKRMPRNADRVTQQKEEIEQILARFMSELRFDRPVSDSAQLAQPDHRAMDHRTATQVKTVPGSAAESDAIRSSRRPQSQSESTAGASASDRSRLPAGAERPQGREPRVEPIASASPTAHLRRKQAIGESSGQTSNAAQNQFVLSLPRSAERVARLRPGTRRADSIAQLQNDARSAPDNATAPLPGEHLEDAFKRLLSEFGGRAESRSDVQLQAHRNFPASDSKLSDSAGAIGPRDKPRHQPSPRDSRQLKAKLNVSTPDPDDKRHDRFLGELLNELDQIRNRFRHD